MRTKGMDGRLLSVAEEDCGGNLLHINRALSAIEDDLLVDAQEQYANIWILGLPRSGTTLLSQILFNCLDVACTNSLMARFWQAPIVGCALSHAVLGDEKSDDYTSHYARTNDVRSPHEFSYFWRRALRIDDLATYNPAAQAGSIDWARLRSELLNMNQIMDKGFVFKVLEFAGYHLERFARMLPKSLFVYVERDPCDVAASLACARVAQCGNLEEWWSSYPPEYAELVGLPPEEQIAGQVFYLRRMYDRGFRCLPEGRLVCVSYTDLCKAPQAFLDVVLERLSVLSDEYPKQVARPPEAFVPTSPDVSPDIAQRLSDALKGRGLGDLA